MDIDFLKRVPLFGADFSAKRPGSVISRLAFRLHGAFSRLSEVQLRIAAPYKRGNFKGFHFSMTLISRIMNQPQK